MLTNLSQLPYEVCTVYQFTDGETEVWRSQITCLKLHRLDLNPGTLAPDTALSHYSGLWNAKCFAILLSESHCSVKVGWRSVFIIVVKKASFLSVSISSAEYDSYLLSDPVGKVGSDFFTFWNFSIVILTRSCFCLKLTVEPNFSLAFDFTVSGTRMFKIHKHSFNGICWICSFGHFSFKFFYSVDKQYVYSSAVAKIIDSIYCFKALTFVYMYFPWYNVFFSFFKTNFQPVCSTHQECRACCNR